MSDVSAVTPPASAPVSVVADDYTIQSSGAPEPAPPQGDEPDPSTAAKVLGRKGGEASAAKRAAQATETPDQEPEPEPEPEPVEAKGTEEPAKTRKGDPRHDPTARVRQATREAKEAREAAARYEAELRAERAERERLQVEYERLNPQKEEGPRQRAYEHVLGPPPKPEDFPEYEQYVDALTDYKIAERDTHMQETQGAQRYQQAVHSVLSAAGRTHLEFMKTTPDFMERVSPEIAELETSPSAHANGRRLGPRNAVADEIAFISAGKVRGISAELGPALMLYLTDHDDELQPLFRLRSPEEIRVELQVLARSLATGKTSGAATAGTAPKVYVSKAPDPVRPVTGAPHAAELSDDADYDTHVKVMNAKERQARVRPR